MDSLSMRRLRIGFDIGGVLSKYPNQFRLLINALQQSALVEIHVITDIPNRGNVVALLDSNGFSSIPPDHIHIADFGTHGELCKARVTESVGIDIMIDDFPGYLAQGPAIRLLVWPEPNKPYVDPDWKSIE